MGCIVDKTERDKLQKKLPDMVSPKRLAHIKGVADTAVVLANRFSEDPEKAELAGILHDAMRSKSDAQLLRLAEQYGVVVDDYIKRNPSLLHGPVAAAWAQRELGMEDEAVLQAIRAHTLGDAEMEKLTCILYLSDAMEPGRDYQGVAELRQLCEKDLYQATLLALEQSKAHVVSKGSIVHPISECARAALYKKIEEENKIDTKR